MHKQTKFLQVQNKLMQLAYKLSVLLRRLLEVFYKGALSAAHSLELGKCRRGNLGTAVPKINRDSAVTQASVDWNFTSESLVVICCFSGQKVSTAARASWQQWGDTAHEIQSSCFFQLKNCWPPLLDRCAHVVWIPFMVEMSPRARPWIPGADWSNQRNRIVSCEEWS